MGASDQTATREEYLAELEALSELERKKCETSYFKFFQLAWEVMEPQTLKRKYKNGLFFPQRFSREVLMKNWKRP